MDLNIPQTHAKRQKQSQSLPDSNTLCGLINGHCPAQHGSGIWYEPFNILLRAFLPISGLKLIPQIDGVENVIFTGSLFEGLSVPSYNSRLPSDEIVNHEQFQRNVKHADTDVMFASTDIVCVQSTATTIILNDHDQQLLRRIGSGQVKKAMLLPTTHHPCYFNLVNETGEYYDDVHMEFKGEVIRHGPALNVLPIDEIEVDNVPCVRVVGWPVGANEWFTRSRQYSFPSAETLFSVRNNAQCFVVHVPHASSPSPDIEWRLSFSIQERILSRSVSLVQRKAYILFKLAVKRFLKDKINLSSYMLKNVFFWTLERTPSTIWVENNMLQLVEGLVEELIFCFERKTLSNFIFGRNNMVSHWTIENIIAAMDELICLKRRLPHLYLHFDQQYTFQDSRLQIPSEENLSETLSVVYKMCVAEQLNVQYEEVLFIMSFLASSPYRAYEMLVDLLVYAIDYTDDPRELKASLSTIMDVDYALRNEDEISEKRFLYTINIAAFLEYLVGQRNIKSKPALTRLLPKEKISYVKDYIRCLYYEAYGICQWNSKCYVEEFSEELFLYSGFMFSIGAYDDAVEVVDAILQCEDISLSIDWSTHHFTLKQWFPFFSYWETIIDMTTHGISYYFLVRILLTQRKFTDARVMFVKLVKYINRHVNSRYFVDLWFKKNSTCIQEMGFGPGDDENYNREYIITSLHLVGDLLHRLGLPLLSLQSFSLAYTTGRAVVPMMYGNNVSAAYFIIVLLHKTRVFPEFWSLFKSLTLP